MDTTKVIQYDDEHAQETYINIDKRDDGFYYAVSGTSLDGLYYETDDSGPFATEEAAEDGAREYLKNYHE